MSELANLLKEFHIAAKISIFVYDENKKLTGKFKQTVSPNFPAKFLHKIEPTLPAKSCRVFNTSKNECFSVLCLPSKKYHLLVFWCNLQTITTLGYFHDSFPSVSLERLIANTRIFYFSLFKQLPEIDKPAFINDPEPLINDDNDQKQIYHNSYYRELLMLKSLEKGNLAEFKPRLKSFIESGTFGKMATGNELRNSKDLLIAATTLFTRAAIKGGMHPESAYQLSDKCVQRIERLTQINSIVDLTQEIGEIFLSHIRTAQNFSKATLIFLIQDYIYQHLNEPVDLNQMSKQLNYSKNYLCRIFKQATNQTIVDYANEQKIREVQSQLVFSNKSITEIAAMLGFYDQSYLTKLFKRYLGTTPIKFRQKYHM
ncbi:helix-turn-helix transcriptional regulator [Liquorilactobacillus sicerae]|uniref:helix-turn-helix transcriptional regulator n=1 Tax=Liquorilactobacillus sicerae TaxID=1416943 RepID=UPI0024814FD3|nr:helix-turn-helix transcriptional regulator [Liquorilactobacillus sicerae]